MNAIDRTKYMDASEVRRLCTVAEAHCLVDLKAGRLAGVLAWAVVDTALQTGLRVSEIARMDVGDLDARRRALRVRRSKKRARELRSETLPFSKGLAEHLAQFIEWKSLVGQSVKPDAPMFVGKRGRLTESGLQRIWHHARERAGLPAELSIHSARHTLAVHLLRKTGNLRMVQKQLGHSRPEVTANLYADVSFEDMQAGLDGVYDQPQGDDKRKGGQRDR